MFVKILITVLCGAKATLSVVKATFSEAKATVSVATFSEARAISSEARVSEAVVAKAGVVAIADAVVSVVTVRQSDHLLESAPKKQLVIS